MHKLASDATGGFTAGSVRELYVLSRAAVTHRPPPEPPDLYSIAVREGATTAEMVITLAMSRTTEDLKEVEIRVRSGAEDGAVVKGKVDVTDHDDGGLGVREPEPPEAADISHGIRTPSDSGPKYSGSKGAILTATVTSGDLAQKLRRFFVLKPPHLLTAVFPWNRDDDSMVEQGREREAKVQGAGSRSGVGASWKVGKGAVEDENRGGQCVSWVTVMGEMVMAIGGGAQRKRIDPLFSFSVNVGN
ncbi:hypothetical protein PIB30_024233 [Stylosanthes scabra]|uniref:Uncharacterized protein n=1 Tax=Stylosanthes scabra TaxID=79078 RepID=A0ABU6S9U3_9FABA|nr:hypothetical protein [Stylosanthes scabra]